ncbi:hypothetical protein HYDPIDRAFT_148213 [Hydnomerulius pinastri MD-312]|nr:hypothetical protein HYDPIDRAFT_148213 [Hydnomerulius pinastri MD-312]
MTTTSVQGSLIDVRTKYVSPSEPALPALGLHITTLVDSYMVWVGVTEESPETVQNAPRSGSLCKDWACAMPSTPGSTALGPATSLFRSSGSDVALSMAQRLARRFRKQIFLSVDIPPTFLATAQGSRILLDAEKGIVEALKGIETAS